MTAASAAVTLALGVLIGGVGTLIGSGGGFLLVPLLLLGYRFVPPTAAGTSLALVFLNAGSGSLAYLRQRRVDFSLGLKFAAATVPGAIGGAFVARALSSSSFSLVFGLVAVGMAVPLFLGRTVPPSRRAARRQLVDTSGESHEYRVDAWKGMLASLGVGFISSALGIGGGIIHVPFLIVILGLPVHVATATSQFVLSISAGVGAATFLMLGHMDLPTTALMGAGIFVGAQLGARVSLKTSGTVIRQILAIALALVGIRMIIHGVGGL